ncbi:MAG: hypothetical protein AAF628_31275 [Planctomycetota bacterium]
MACTQATTPPQPQEAGPGTAHARAKLEAVLERHHGPLRGTFDRVVLELRETPEAKPVRIAAELPDQLRVDRPGRRVDLWVKGDGWLCQSGAAASRLQGDGLAELAALRQCVRALTLDPLVRADQVREMGPGIFALVMPGGETWRLELDAAQDHVRELRGPAGAVTFVEFLRTGVTTLPRLVDLPGIGKRHVKFAATDLWLSPAVFRDPFVSVDATRKATKPHRQTVIAPTRELPKHAEIQELPAKSFLVLEDPGDWQERAAAVTAAGNTLGARGQMPDGLPTYLTDGTRRLLLIPFRPDPNGGHQPFVRGPKETLRHDPPREVAVVAPPADTWDRALAEGRRRLAELIASEGRKADGPLHVTPFIEPTMPPDAGLRKALQLRLEQPLRDRN